jgi:hypothetical protein
MPHWLAVVGACLALAGTLVLGFDLLNSKDDDAAEEEFRAGQDEIESTVRETVIGLRGALINLSGLVAGYLKNLELDLEPVLEPLLKGGGDPGLKLSVAARHVVIEEFDQAQRDFASSGDSEDALTRIRDVQQRTEKRFARQTARARRMRIVAMLGVVLVGIGAVAQLLDAVLHS